MYALRGGSRQEDLNSFSPVNSFCRAAGPVSSAGSPAFLCAPGKPSALGPAGLRLWIMIGPRRRRVPIRGIVKRRFPSGKFRGQGGHAHHAMPSMTRGQVVGFIPPLSRHGGLWLVGRASPFLVSQICLRTGILSRTVSAFDLLLCCSCYSILPFVGGAFAHAWQPSGWAAPKIPVPPRRGG